MKKTIIAMSIALLVGSMGSSLASAAPTGEDTTEPMWGSISSSVALGNVSASQSRLTWPTGENPTPPSRYASSTPAVHVEIPGPIGEDRTEPHMNLSM